MNNFKNKFSIKDLENLSGIKAHTIRIWEKRYNLLQPDRTDTNIRYYDLESLQKLLNVSFLNDNGHKISKIAYLEKEKIASLVRKIALKTDSNDHSFNLLKLSMLNFDQTLFYKTYDNLAKQLSFSEIFKDVFIPLLSEIGVLWQTDTITPAHEHFISSLIRQKIVANTEIIQKKNIKTSKSIFVLFLPDNEIHELGLMYLHYEIISKKHQSILLGPSVPVSSLVDILNYHDDITFVSYFTIKPEKDEIMAYLKGFEENILKKKKSNLWLLGKMLEHIDPKKLPNKIKAFHSIDSLIKKL